MMEIGSWKRSLQFLLVLLLVIKCTRNQTDLGKLERTTTRITWNHHMESELTSLCLFFDVFC